MNRATARGVAAVLLCVAASACSVSEARREPGTVVGVVVGIRSRSFGDVEAFSLRGEGRTYEVFVDPTRDYGFPLSHLQAHRVSAEPVGVRLERRGNKLYALSIVDARTGRHAG